MHPVKERIDPNDYPVLVPKYERNKNFDKEKVSSLSRSVLIEQEVGSPNKFEGSYFMKMKIDEDYQSKREEK